MVAHSSSYQASLPTATWQIQYFPVRDCNKLQQTCWRSLFHHSLLTSIHLRWENEPSMSLYGTCWCLFSLVSFPWSFQWSSGSPLRLCWGAGQDSEEEPLSPSCGTLPSWIIVNISTFILFLSVFGNITEKRFPLCFPPWHAEQVKSTKDSLLTCLQRHRLSKLSCAEPYLGKVKYSVVSGLVLNFRMFPGYNFLFLLIW